MAYTVPDLPYPYEALEPHISAQTMRFHHDKHHQAYVDKANAALDGTGLEDAPPSSSSRPPTRTARSPTASSRCWAWRSSSGASPPRRCPT